jgi:hypothetical protein
MPHLFHVFDRHQAGLRGAGLRATNLDRVPTRDDGVWTAINDRNRGFKTPKFTPGLFGYNQGWHGDKYPRLTIDPASGSEGPYARIDLDQRLNSSLQGSGRA